MADHENHPPEQDKPDKKLRLDLSEAMPHGFDEDDDDIIELKDEVNSLSKQPEISQKSHADIDDEIEASELPAVENIIDLDALEDDDSDPENVIRLSDDLAFQEEDEEADEILPIESEPVLKADNHDEVAEVTEFDDILSEDTSEMMTLSEISEVLDTEEEEDDDDEFLELIDVEEDDENEQEEIEDIIQFDGSDDDVEDAELKDFINDSLDEEIQINEDFEKELASTLGVEAREEINLAEQAATEEDFDFSMDSSEISKKIEQLETIFSDDIDEETELDEDAEIDEGAELYGEAEIDEGAELYEEAEIDEGAELYEEAEIDEGAELYGEAEIDEGAGLYGEAEPDIEVEPDEVAVEIPEPEFDDSQDDLYEIKTEDAEISDDEIEDVAVSGGESIDVPLVVGGGTTLNASQDQMEKIIEEIIERKFSGKIESKIIQIIEKAVTKEIERLKKILLEDDRDEDLL
ncbi:MAG: hypothetical protein PVF86_09650 [Desulfobacterales bacterium]|jgi:hypothetical protein